MSQNYCVQLEPPFQVISITTTKPVNFTSLQFSLNVNALVIFLFSKYPFNYGSENYFCINKDEFGFALYGTNFNVDLSNYQGYYMLILIYQDFINYGDYSTCAVIDDLIITFQNTTISPIYTETVTINSDGVYQVEFCQCYNEQKQTISTTCGLSIYIPAISLNELNNELMVLSCQSFVWNNNTSVGFAIPEGCKSFGTIVTAPIKFIASQDVIENIAYHTYLKGKILPLSSCQPSKMSSCSIPCKSIYQITKLLTPPKKYSLISSKLWNEIVQDLYLAYDVYKYIKYLSQFPYPQYIPYVISDFYDFYENFRPYVFTPLIRARKGLPLTADYFNSLIDAIIELANFANIQLQKRLSYVQPDEIVKALQFDYVVDNVNQFLTFNFNQYFLLDCFGNKFNNLLKSTTTFLNVLIDSIENNITISNNVYIKNFLIYSNLQTIDIYGSIFNLIMNLNYGIIRLLDNSSVNSLIIENNQGGIYIYNNSYIDTLSVKNNLLIISVNDNAVVNTLKVENNNFGIYINNNAIVENLICNKNSGSVVISSNATVINNQCTS